MSDEEEDSDDNPISTEDLQLYHKNQIFYLLRDMSWISICW